MAYGIIGLLFTVVSDEAEAAGPAGFTIAHHDAIENLTEL